jgi:hypothetical protein
VLFIRAQNVALGDAAECLKPSRKQVPNAFGSGHKGFAAVNSRFCKQTSTNVGRISINVTIAKSLCRWVRQKTAETTGFSRVQKQPSTFDQPRLPKFCSTVRDLHSVHSHSVA